MGVEDEVVSGAVSRPGPVSSGAEDQSVSWSGGAAVSGRMSGDMTAAPANTGAVNGCTA